MFQPPGVSGQDSIWVSTAVQVFDPGQDFMRQTPSAQHAYGVLIHSTDISCGPYHGLGLVLSAGVRTNQRRILGFKSLHLKCFECFNSGRRMIGSITRDREVEGLSNGAHSEFSFGVPAGH